MAFISGVESAKMASFLFILSILSCLFFTSSKYVPIEVDVPSHVHKVFTAQDIANYDGSDVSN